VGVEKYSTLTVTVRPSDAECEAREEKLAAARFDTMRTAATIANRMTRPPDGTTPIVAQASSK